MAYRAIEDHGVIGDLRTIALVGTDGTIDWCCLPHFDSPAVFGSILDDKIGGFFALNARGQVHHRQTYVADSNVLVTRAYADHGLGQIEDFMPVAGDSVHRIIRIVSCVRGEVEYELRCSPAFNFARVPHIVRKVEGGVVFECEGDCRFALSSPVPLEIDGPAACARIRLKEGERRCFVFLEQPKGDADDPFRQLGDPAADLKQTLEFWQSWLQRCSYRGRWNETIYRSALLLKLLTFEPTGAIVAAPTMALPEHLGGVRNWDYRYTWIRDASFTLYGLMRIGYTDEAGAFMRWLTERCAEADFEAESPLRIMYGIHGEREIPESILGHLSGYRESSPVRLGNAAFNHLQLDIYGELMDSVYLYNKYGSPVSFRLWNDVRRLMDWVAEHWDQKDEGIWETRGGRQNFVYSRLMSWVALDRASRMSVKHSLPGNRNGWMRERDRIYDQIMTRGWNEKRQAFRLHYDTDALDAANLCMPLMKFISPTDPRMLSTIDATLESLTTDSLVYRYDPELSPDGLHGNEGTFSMCTFWLVEALTRAGRVSEAREVFERMLGYANHLGLYSEEIGINGEALGNFPQAFTHMALISAGYNLDRAISRG